MNEADTFEALRNDVPHDQLFKLRGELELLTKLYIESLFASRDNTAKFAKMLYSILDSIADGLLVNDRDGKVLLANKRAIDLCGIDMLKMSREEFIDRYQIYEADGETRIPIDQLPYEIVRKGGKTAEKEGLVKGVGLPPEGIWVRSHSAPIRDDNGDILGIVTVFNDISQKKRLQLERNTLASLITHDLKNHLSATISVLDLLSESLFNKLELDEQKLLSELRSDSMRFLEISKTMMEVYRMDLYTMEKQHTVINIKDVLKEAVALTDQLGKKHGVRIVLDGVPDNLPQIKGTLVALRQVFHNLLHNAITASSSGQTVEVTCVREKDNIVVHITDYGLGISANELFLLFEPVRVTHKWTGGSSTGFGLYLSRRIIEAHDGSISCQSTPSKGTTFTIYLPIYSHNK